MMDAFEELGLERRLVMSADDVRQAFREAGKHRHPDAGGTAADFETLQKASEILTHPSTRLRHWLELEQIPGEMRGPVGSVVMDQFAAIGPVLQEADKVVREKNAAGSLLAKALLEGRVQEVRERIEAVQEQLEAERIRLEESFSAVESGAEDGWRVARELAFLGKWSAQLKERFAALW